MHGLKHPIKFQFQMACPTKLLFCCRKPDKKHFPRSAGWSCETNTTLMTRSRDCYSQMPYQSKSKQMETGERRCQKHVRNPGFAPFGVTYCLRTRYLEVALSFELEPTIITSQAEHTDAWHLTVESTTPTWQSGCAVRCGLHAAASQARRHQDLLPAEDLPGSKR